MGCDIHMVLEKRWAPEGGEPRWVGVNAFPSSKAGIHGFGAKLEDGRQLYELEAHIRWPVRDRNYDLFAALAGVRGHGPDPKGVPDDASDLAKMKVDEWGSDGHSHTYYLLSEAMPIFLRYQLGGVRKKIRGEDHTSEWPIERRALEYFWEGWAGEGEPGLDQFRLIIWFDN